ncbi:MAG TPA: DUF192 domain-containing protein [Nitrospiraceae bacterium]|nr:DUF192 domain-containing protein [Nitrospiraceae bacterium]
MEPCRPLLLFLILLSFPFYALAGNDPSSSGLIPITLPEGTVIQAELANTPQKRAEGLMYREHLAADRGMLFTFSQAQAWVFWMKNTKIPLDLIWINEKREIVHIEPRVPICTRTDDSCPQYRPNEGALYVLELAAGRAESLKLQRGSKLQFRLP